MHVRNEKINSVFVVDDHPIVRQGLCQLFEREPDFAVCGVAASAAEAIENIDRTCPDLVVTDLTLEHRSGLDLARQLRAFRPNLPILIVSMHDEQLYAERALAAGARGYIMKRRDEGEILRAAREVLAGRVYVSKEMRERLPYNAYAGPKARPSPLAALTDREMEVFMLIGQGYAPRHIAEQLSLSVSTVEVYRERLKEKLHLDNSALLLRYAVRWSRDHGES